MADELIEWLRMGEQRIGAPMWKQAADEIERLRAWEREMDGALVKEALAKDRLRALLVRALPELDAWERALDGEWNDTMTDETLREEIRAALAGTAETGSDPLAGTPCGCTTKCRNIPNRVCVDRPVPPAEAAPNIAKSNDRADGAAFVHCPACGPQGTTWFGSLLRCDSCGNVILSNVSTPENRAREFPPGFHTGDQCPYRCAFYPGCMCGHQDAQRTADQPGGGQ